MVRSEAILAAVALAFGPGCSGELDVTDPVAGDAQPCVTDAGQDDPLCGRPPIVLRTARLETHDVLFAGVADGTLLRVTDLAVPGVIESDARSVGTGFGGNSRLLVCDVDGSGLPEIIVAGNGNLDPGFLLWEGELSDPQPHPNQPPS